MLRPLHFILLIVLAYTLTVLASEEELPGKPSAVEEQPTDTDNTKNDLEADASAWGYGGRRYGGGWGGWGGGWGGKGWGGGWGGRGWGGGWNGWGGRYGGWGWGR